MPDWIIQLIFNFLFSGLVSGIVVAVVKARMEHFYQRKHEDDKRSESAKEKMDKQDHENRKLEISSLKNEIIALKGKVNLVAEKVSLMKENLAVVSSKQDGLTDRVGEVNEMVKSILQTNFGKVKVIK